MPSLKIIGLLVLKIFKGFTICGCGGHLNHVTGPFLETFVPLPMDASREIWLRLTKWFQRSLKMVDRGQMPLSFHL